MSILGELSKDVMINGITTAIQGLGIPTNEIQEKFNEFKGMLNSIPKDKVILIHLDAESNELELIIVQKDGLLWEGKETTFNISEIAEDIVNNLVN